MKNNYELLDEYSFLEKLVADTVGDSKGKKIIPLVGAGISVASGIPAIPEIQEYLKNCVNLAMNTSNTPQPWTQNYRWPDFNFFIKNPQASNADPSNWNEFVLSGIGATADWRKSLDFLSRIDPMNPGRTGPPNGGVIDSFFRHVTAGRRPNLFHRMIANLASIGCIDLMLTTNFDELLENAIKEFPSLRLTVLEIHHHTELPSYSTLESRESRISLIKLHGGRFGLRVDDSLDRVASENELRNFESYFFSGESSEQGAHRESSACLFVAGISLHEKRMLSLISTLRVKNGPNIYLCCFNDEDVKTAIQLDSELESLPKRNSADSGDRPKIYIHKAQDSGLLLFRFYQMMNQSLPARGGVTANQVNVPWPTNIELFDEANDGSQKVTAGDDERIFDQGEIIILQSRKKAQSRKDDSTRRFNEVAFLRSRREINEVLNKANASGVASVISVFGNKEYQGVSALMAAVFHDRREAGEACLWFDLDTAGSTDDFYEKLIECLSEMNAEKTWSNPRRRWTNEFKVDELKNVINCKRGRWLIMINAREGAGTNGPKVSEKVREEMAKPDPPENGWLDLSKKDIECESKAKTQSTSTDNYDDFLDCFSSINDSGSEINATFVLIAHKNVQQIGGKKTSMFYQKIEEKVVQRIVLDADVEEGSIRFAGPKSTVENQEGEWSNSCLIEFGAELSTLNEESIQDNVLNWLLDDEPLNTSKTKKGTISAEHFRRVIFAKLRFLIAILKMRKPRSWAVPFGYAFSRSKHKDLFFDESLPLESSTETAAINKEEFIKQLVNAGLIRLKPGGFLWLNSRARDQLLLLLEGLGQPDKIRTDRDKKAFKKKLESIVKDQLQKGLLKKDIPQAMSWLTGVISFGVASFYRRELQATGEAISAIDAVRHYVDGCGYFLKLLQQRFPDGVSGKSDDILRASCDFIKSGTAYSGQLLQDYEFAVVHQGVANCKCRRFESILDDIDELFGICESLPAAGSANLSWKLDIFKSLHRLRIKLLKTAMLVAQETGFIRRAYVRSRQIIWAGWLSNQLDDLSIKAAKRNLGKASFEESVRRISESSMEMRNLGNDLPLDVVIENEKNEKAKKDLVKTRKVKRAGEVKRNKELRSKRSKDWLAFQRCITVLHIASRSYFNSQHSIIRLMECLIESSSDVVKNPFSKLLLMFEARREEKKEISQTEFLASFREIKRFGIIGTGGRDLQNRKRKLAEELKGCGPGKFHVTNVSRHGVDGATILAMLYQAIAAKWCFEYYIEYPSRCSSLSQNHASELVKIGIRQMQLSAEVATLVDFVRELDGEYLSIDRMVPSAPHKLVRKLDGLRERSLETATVAYSAATQVMDWFGNEKSKAAGGDNSDRTQLLSEMQKIETYSAVVKRLKGLRPLKEHASNTNGNNSLSKNHRSEKHTSLGVQGEFRESLRSLDHALAWLDKQPNKVSTAIILLERAALHLSYAEGRYFDCSDIFESDKRFNRENSNSEKTKANDPSMFRMSFSSCLRLSIASQITNLESGEWNHDLVSKTRYIKKHVKRSANDLIKKLFRSVEENDSDDSKGGQESDALDAKRNSWLTGILEKAKIGDRLVGDALNLISQDTQSVWWKGYADQLSLEAQRTYLAVSVGLQKAPVSVMLAVRHKWNLEFQDIMERMDDRLYLDSIRYSRCLHLFCDCTLFIFVMMALEKLDENFRQKLSELQHNIARYKDRLVSMVAERRKLENYHERCFGSQLSEMYFERTKSHCDRTSKIISLASNLAGKKQR